MSIWISRSALGLVSALTLAGCDGANPLAQLMSGSASTPLSDEAQMARGDVLLRAPVGYCMDPRNTQARFALIAPCASLGQEDAQSVAAALIAVSIAPLAEGRGVPDATAMTAALGWEDTLNTRESDGLTLVQGRAANLREGFSATEWRGSFAQNGHLVAMTLYAPEGGVSETSDGAALLQAIARRSNAANDG